MYEKSEDNRLPLTVDQAAERLLNDMREIERLNIMVLNEQAFRHVYESVAPMILNEFRIWTGNEVLLNSCMQSLDAARNGFEPALVILRKVREKAFETYEY